jgi:hypothetical protein
MPTAAPLVTAGYVVLQFTGDAAALCAQFDTMMQTMPDHQLTEPPYSVGGFCALGNAFSFHHSYARRLRTEGYEFLKPLLAEVFDHRYIELLVDRLTYRQAGLKPSAESYHRDLTPAHMCHKSDRIYGGYLNCNATESQYFTCVPGTHTEVHNHAAGSGFSKLTASQRKRITDQQLQRRIEVPAGALLLFDQRLIHAVNPTANKFDLRRKHMNIRLTNHRAPLLHNIRDLLVSGSVVPLKSGQQPPMFPRLYNVNWTDRLIAVSERYPAAMKHMREMTGRRMIAVGLPEQEYSVLQMYCPSLTEMGIPFEAYTETELALYVPHAL